MLASLVENSTDFISIASLAKEFAPPSGEGRFFYASRQPKAFNTESTEHTEQSFARRS